MIQLVLVLCLSASPTSCVEDRPMPEQAFTMSSCLSSSAAQQAAVEWMQEHPGYELRRWKCEIGKREERPA